MIDSSTDRAWEKLGKSDPYFGVLSTEKYQKQNLTENRIHDFFSSGYEYIDCVLNDIKKHIDPTFSIKKALDFGCGVGRLVIPLADIAERVVGLDVSESMLAEAKKNCESRSIKNVNFLKNDDNLSPVLDTYDFIHSYIVFQHIPVQRGEYIFEKLLNHLEDGGVGVVHFTYAKKDKMSPLRKAVTWFKSHVPLANCFFNVIRGRRFFAPFTQMNDYNLNKLFLLLQNNNVNEVFCKYSDHGGNMGTVLYFRKNSSV